MKKLSPLDCKEIGNKLGRKAGRKSQLIRLVSAETLETWQYALEHFAQKHKIGIENIDLITSEENWYEAKGWIMTAALDGRHFNGHNPNDLPANFRRPPKYGEPTKRVNLRVPESVVDALAKKQGEMSMSEHYVQILRKEAENS